MKLYLDANSIIYAIESVSPFRDEVINKIKLFESQGGTVITSILSKLECRVKPLRDGESNLLAKFDAFFTQTSVKVVEIDEAIIDKATELRATYGFKTPDAIHLATAIKENSDLFLTGDASLSRCVEAKVEIL
ncbi:MAG: type II toxin-antitoxin system VapC family toxin [Acidobacteriota bacterium]